MVAKESNDYDYDYDQLQDFDHDGAETLSLCDLVESSNTDYSYSHQRASDDQDFFEFFSEDFTAASSASAYPKDNIIFCGKLISYKQESAVNSEQTRNQNKNRIFPWKSSNSFNMSRSASSKSKSKSKSQSQEIKSSYSTTSNYRALSQRRGYPYNSYEHDFSSSTAALATSVKPRWYLLAFGHGRFPSEVKLRDIKNRQSRRRVPAMMSRADDDGGEVVKRSSEKRSSPWKGFWTLLKVLGCKSQQANAVVRLEFN